MPKPKPTESAEPQIPEYQSWDEVSAAGKLVLDTSASADALQARLDQEVADLTERYRVGWTENGARVVGIAELRGEAEVAQRGMEAFTSAHRREFPEGRKSRDLTHCVVGYELGKPTVELIMKKTEDVIEAIRKHGGKLAKEFIRQPKPPAPAVDKAAVLKARGAGEVTDAELKQMGLRVTQDETFFVKTYTAPVIVN